MIGSHHTPTTPTKLRRAILVARKTSNPVTVSLEAITGAGLPLGSADLDDWVNALPGIDWYHIGAHLTIHFDSESIA